MLNQKVFLSACFLLSERLINAIKNKDRHALSALYALKEAHPIFEFRLGQYFELIWEKALFQNMPAEYSTQIKTYKRRAYKYSREAAKCFADSIYHLGLCLERSAYEKESDPNLIENALYFYMIAAHNGYLYASNRIKYWLNATEPPISPELACFSDSIIFNIQMTLKTYFDELGLPTDSEDLQAQLTLSPDQAQTIPSVYRDLVDTTVVDELSRPIILKDYARRLGVPNMKMEWLPADTMQLNALVDQIIDHQINSIQSKQPHLPQYRIGHMVDTLILTNDDDGVINPVFKETNPIILEDPSEFPIPLTLRSEIQNKIDSEIQKIMDMAKNYLCPDDIWITLNSLTLKVEKRIKTLNHIRDAFYSMEIVLSWCNSKLRQFLISPSDMGLNIEGQDISNIKNFITLIIETRMENIPDEAPPNQEIPSPVTWVLSHVKNHSTYEKLFGHNELPFTQLEFNVLKFFMNYQGNITDTKLSALRLYYHFDKITESWREELSHSHDVQLSALNNVRNGIKVSHWQLTSTQPSDDLIILSQHPIERKLLEFMKQPQQIVPELTGPSIEDGTACLLLKLQLERMVVHYRMHVETLLSQTNSDENAHSGEPSSSSSGDSHFQPHFVNPAKHEVSGPKNKFQNS